MIMIGTIIICAWFVIEVLFAIFCQLTAPLFKLLGNAILWILEKTLTLIIFIPLLPFIIIIGIVKGYREGKTLKEEKYNYDFYQLDKYTQDLIKRAKRNNHPFVHNGQDLFQVKDFLA